MYLFLPPSQHPFTYIPLLCSLLLPISIPLPTFSSVYLLPSPPYLAPEPLSPYHTSTSFIPSSYIPLYLTLCLSLPPLHISPPHPPPTSLLLGPYIPPPTHILSTSHYLLPLYLLSTSPTYLLLGPYIPLPTHILSTSHYLPPLYLSLPTSSLPPITYLLSTSHSLPPLYLPFPTSSIFRPP
jgi:hypothetical protein